MALVEEDGSVVTGANTYASASYITTIWDDQSLLMDSGDDASGESSSDIEAAIHRAMIYIESRSYKGVKTDRSNPLQWPRDGVEDDDGYAIESDEIPVEVLKALARASYEELKEEGSLQPNISRDDLVKKEKVDVIETEYFPYMSPTSTEFTVINAYLKGLVTSNGNAAIERV